MVKTLYKELELLVSNSLELLEKIEVKEILHKYFGERNGTHISLDINFDEENKLYWVHASFQWKVEYQFSVKFLHSISEDWYISIEFSSNFYNLNDIIQSRRIKYFIQNFKKVVDIVTSDKNIELKRELLVKKREIEKQLLTL